jgi:ubiquitin-associated protein 1
LDSPADTPSEECSPPPLVTRPTPNPFDQLPPSAQRQAKQISEMGFPVAKVVRACKLIGEDQKQASVLFHASKPQVLERNLCGFQVVDFLLRVQALEEKGFPDSRVEYVLGTLKMDEEKAHQFLPVFVQLVDLGFTEDKVSEALLQAGCDRDKALDVLLS